jgi:hypothetical protein
MDRRWAGQKSPLLKESKTQEPRNPGVLSKTQYHKKEIEKWERDAKCQGTIVCQMLFGGLYHGILNNHPPFLTA